MSPLSPISQILPTLPMPQLSPGGAMPFVLTGGAEGMTTAESGPFAGFDCKMPVSDEPVADTSSNPPPTPVPAAVLLASLDRSARAFIVPPSPTSPHLAKVPSIGGHDTALSMPGKSDDTEMSEPFSDSESAPLATQTALIAQFTMPVSTAAVRLTVPTAPIAESTASAPIGPMSLSGTVMPAKPTAVDASTVPVTVAIGASAIQVGLSAPPTVAASPASGDRSPVPVTTDQPVLQGSVAKPSDVLPQSPVERAVARWLPVQDDRSAVVAAVAMPPVAVSAIVAPAAPWVMEVDAPRQPGLVAPRGLTETAQEPVVPVIFSVPTRKATVKDAVSLDDLGKVAREVTAPPPNVTGFAQPASSPASIVELSAAPLTSLEIAGIDRQLDLARGDAWLDTLARDIATSADGGGRLRFGLAPERLGKLDVEVSRSDSGVSIHMTTRNDEARTIIAAAQPRLVEELRAQGTRVASADVSAQTGEQSGSTPQPRTATLIETAVEARVPVADTATDTTASGRYA